MHSYSAESIQQLVEKIHQLESQHVLDKTLLEQKERTIRALKFDLREYKIVLFIPGMGLIGRLGKLIEPRLGNLYQYHPRTLAIPGNHPFPTPSSLPKISIVTPSFEQGRYLERTVQSVLDQNYPNLEYFVKDGGSTDNSCEILKRYENRLSGWISEPDQGQSHAINQAFIHTTGEIMGWINSDDLLLPGALNRVADYFNTHPNIDVLYGNRLLIDEADMEIGRWILPGHSDTALSWADFIPQETLFWRRSMWKKVNSQVDESFRFAMDWDLLIRFREAGARFAHIPYFIGAFRIHEYQKTSAANDIGYKESKRIQERIHGQIPSKRQIRRAVIPFLLRHIAVDFVYLVKSRLTRKKYKDVFANPEHMEEARHPSVIVPG
jgi:glycosyltransferase involved in cell wall biosynthesis